MKNQILKIVMILMLCIPNAFAKKDFEFIPNQWLSMPDGAKLSISYWKPKGSQKFPIVLEVLPYRKDDIMYLRDYPIGAYLAGHGIGFARVDIRGTGSSEGTLPDREYSDQELTDIQNIIKQLAALPWSNGKIGMQGISWSAFNSIMTAMQRPTHLKGILVAHGSDDIYANDIHNIDGALHIDIFTLQIEVDSLLPQSSHYKVDDNYFKNRFDQKPWIFTYLNHQRDSEFWQQNRSLKTDYSAINIPVYAFASLLDGYRDFAINKLNNVKSPIKVAVGPQNHAWPDSEPGPQYEWRYNAVRFWQQVLKNRETHILNEPNFTFIMRDSPSKNNVGTYYTENWPLKNIHKLRLIPQKNGTLTTSTQQKDSVNLVYRPSVGMGLLNWWGEETPDMRPADEGTLIFDSEPLTEDLYLVGNPQVQLKVSSSAPLAHWITRLEDVSPEDDVTFVTGGLKNGSQHQSRTQPKAIIPNKDLDLNYTMRFTTWKFSKGHKIRLTVANAQFPMIWPTPYNMTTKLTVGDGSSFIKLPLIPNPTYERPILPALEKRAAAPGGKHLKSESLSPFKVTKDNNGNVFATANENFSVKVNGNIISANYKVTYRINDQNPADAAFLGVGEDSVYIQKEKRRVKVQSTIQIQSDQKYFYTSVVRCIYQNEKLLRTKTWKEKIPRDFQ